MATCHSTHATWQLQCCAVLHRICKAWGPQCTQGHAADDHILNMLRLLQCSITNVYPGLDTLSKHMPAAHRLNGFAAQQHAAYMQLLLAGNVL
jgi:hypothetical protein